MFPRGLGLDEAATERSSSAGTITVGQWVLVTSLAQAFKLLRLKAEGCWPYWRHARWFLLCRKCQPCVSPTSALTSETVRQNCLPLSCRISTIACVSLAAKSLKQLAIITGMCHSHLETFTTTTPREKETLTGTAKRPCKKSIRFLNEHSLPVPRQN